MTKRLTINFRVIETGREFIVSGRVAWALKCLIAAGANGCTPIDHPGPRWSAYVHNLRGLGLDIETVHEAHGGPFKGTHARYVLRSTVCVLDVGGHDAEAA